MLLDPVCVACDRPGRSLCARCAAGLRRAAPMPAPLGLDGWTTVFRYDDVARRVLTGLKNRQRRDLVALLADAVVGATAPPPPDAVITWAPTGQARRRARGFDQAELLARALARRWGRRCRPLLRRLAGPPQAGLGGRARRANPRFSAPRRIPGRVLVVDDVATTGATLTAAARALRERGAVEVQALVVALARGLGSADTTHPGGTQRVDITVSARHIDISPALRAAAEEKLGRLSRFGSEFDRAEVHFLEERNPRIADREVCDVTVQGRGRRLRAKAAAKDSFAAIDLVVEKLEHQLHTLKTKLVTRKHGSRRNILSIAGADDT